MGGLREQRGQLLALQLGARRPQLRGRRLQLGQAFDGLAADRPGSGQQGKATSRCVLCSGDKHESKGASEWVLSKGGGHSMDPQKRIAKNREIKAKKHAKKRPKSKKQKKKRKKKRNCASCLGDECLMLCGGWSLARPGPRWKTECKCKKSINLPRPKNVSQKKNSLVSSFDPLWIQYKLMPLLGGGGTRRTESENENKPKTLFGLKCFD